MQIQQLSVFIENKPGRMAEVTEVLAEANIDIRAISVADTRTSASCVSLWTSPRRPWKS